MLRLVIVLLVLANAGYFAWSQGYLAPLGLAPMDPSEPERLQAQIRPEAVRLLNGPKGQTAPEPAEPQPATPADADTPGAADSMPATRETSTATETSVTAPSPAATEPVAAATPADPTAPAAPAPRTACWLAGGYTMPQAEALRSALAASSLPRSSWQLDETRTGGRWVVYMGRYNDEQMEKKRSELKALGVAFRTLPAPLGPGLALGTFSSADAAELGLQDVSKKGVRSARVLQERAEGSAWTLRLPALTDAQRETVTGLGAALAGIRLQRCE